VWSKQLLVLIHVVPVDGTDLTASVGRLRHRLLAVPAIAAVEITPVERRTELTDPDHQDPGKP
jgi:hypothetical protein